MIGPPHHIGVAVRRLDAALADYRALGFEFESTEDVPAQGVRVAFLRTGGAQIELLESLSPDGVIARFVERRGEGIHHIAFSVPEIRAEIRRLQEQGLELVDAEPRPGAHGRLVAFVHPRSARGVLLELVQESSGWKAARGRQQG
jgi:methylmalonyl-CoA/ethylmalonyl-CoA epimerase